MKFELLIRRCFLEAILLAPWPFLCAEEIVELSAREIVAEAVWLPTQVLPPSGLGHGVPNLARQIASGQGLAWERRGWDTSEPSVRGLGGDRIITSLDGLVFPNASPTRTHAPVNLLGYGQVGELRLHKAFPPVTLGPAGSGAQLAFVFPQLTGPESRKSEVEWAFLEGRRGWTGQVLTQRTLPAEGWRSFLWWADLGDARDGRGRAIDADWRAFGGAILLESVRPSGHHTQIQIGATRQTAADHLALPLDAKDCSLAYSQIIHSWQVDPEVRWKAKLGTAWNDVFLSNETRPQAPRRIEARAESVSSSAALQREVQRGDVGWILGIDARRSTKDALRHRAPATDILWPDVTAYGWGAFCEWRRAWSADWSWLVGGRWDVLWHSAGRGEEMAFGRSVKSLFATWNGTGAEELKRRETAGAAHLLVRGRWQEELQWYVGIGLSRQVAPVSLRYRVFLDALGGGYEIGNPALSPEWKYENAGGLSWRSERWEIKVEGFAAWIQDYILRTRLGFTASPPPPPPGQVVYGYCPTDASFLGGEITLRAKLNRHWSISGNAQAVRGWNETLDRGLPDIAPWEARWGVRREDMLGPWTTRFQVDGRYVTAQDNPSPESEPLYTQTGSFGLLDLSAEIQRGFWTLSISVENLMDRWYAEYLAPPVHSLGSKSGSLRAGEKLPGPGRSWRVAVRCNF